MLNIFYYIERRFCIKNNNFLTILDVFNSQFRQSVIWKCKVENFLLQNMLVNLSVFDNICQHLNPQTIIKIILPVHFHYFLLL